MKFRKYDWDFKPEINFSEEKWLDLYGEELWNKIIVKCIKLFRLNEKKCLGCGFEPVDQKQLEYHIVYYDANNPEGTLVINLCLNCHLIKHFDKIVELDYCVLVNSRLSQQEIIQQGRISNKRLNFLLESKQIMPLKKTPKQYLEEFSKDSMLISEKIKIFYKGNFPWGKCR